MANDKRPKPPPRPPRTPPRGGWPRVFDLFCGMGGWTQGFSDQRGWSCVGGVDLDPDAMRAYLLNHHPNTLPFAGPRDLRDIEDPAACIGRAFGASGIDVLCASPPCQPHSRAGRARKRQLNHDDSARADVVGEVVRWAQALDPQVILMENVVDVVRSVAFFGALDRIERLGYDICVTPLLAWAYGAPQLRDRLYVFASKLPGVSGADLVPPPTRGVELPVGLASHRGVLVDLPARWRAKAPPEVDLPPGATVAEAIGDLPPIDVDAQRGWDMQDGWGHISRKMNARDRAIIRLMSPGQFYSDALAIATRLAEAQRRPVSELMGVRKSAGFNDRWRVLTPDGPSPTLTAHMGKDGVSHLHYDVAQARPISPREAARIQGFPDSYRFPTSMNAAYRLIGNAVTPHVSGSIARHIHHHLIRWRRQCHS